jgi:beta-carotene/zeaxanthin 4-ketolase
MFLLHFMGIFIASNLFLLWVGSFYWGCTQDLSQAPPWLIIITIGVRIFLQTGLFITAHDAMHRSVLPQHYKINDWIGAIALILYAFLPYGYLRKKHQLHHRAPTSSTDPDFCKPHQNNVVLWYLTFMKGYLDGPRRSILLTGMLLTFLLLWQWGHIPMFNLGLYWIFPMGLSSMQLFYFGTFLPHRQQPGIPQNRHFSGSSNYSIFWSFITCYHFGYHWEHHEYPNLPWYQLPEVNQLKLFWKM